MTRGPDRLRVMFVLPSLGGGGAERVTATLLRHLDRTEFDPSLAVVNLRNAAYLDDLPVDVVPVDLGCQRVRYAFWKLVRLIRERRPQVVLSAGGHLNLMLAWLKWLLPRETRLVAYENSVVSVIMRLERQGRLRIGLYKRLYRKLDAIICQSSDIQKDLLENYHVPGGRTHLIHNPVDIERITQILNTASRPEIFNRQQINLVAAGRLSFEKGFDVLIQSLAVLNDKRLNLVIIGAGPLQAELGSLASRLGVDQQIHFAGFQSNPYTWFAAADYFVLSSRVEGFPNVVLEALACGTPVIATPCPGGVREIMVRPDYGWLARDTSVAALVDTLRRAVAGLRPTPSLEDLRTRFGVEQIVARYEALFRSVSGRTHRTA